MKALFDVFDQDGTGTVEVREILAELKAEPSAEETRWTQVGIGKYYLHPSREADIEGVIPSTGQSGFARSEAGNPTAWATTHKAKARPARPASAYVGSAAAPASIFR